MSYNWDKKEMKLRPASVSQNRKTVPLSVLEILDEKNDGTFAYDILKTDGVVVYSWDWAPFIKESQGIPTTLKRNWFLLMEKYPREIQKCIYSMLKKEDLKYLPKEAKKEWKSHKNYRLPHPDTVTESCAFVVWYSDKPLTYVLGKIKKHHFDWQAWAKLDNKEKAVKFQEIQNWPLFFQERITQDERMKDFMLKTKVMDF